MATTQVNGEGQGLEKQSVFSRLAPQTFTALIDAISYMVTAPSIVFYVVQHGGTYQQYGVILSIFSFASFCFKPILGRWSDRMGGKFRAPYLTSIVIGALGGFVYFMASAFTNTHMALAFILMGRLLGGLGAANSTLGYSYIARMLDKQELTEGNTMLSMARRFGIAVAPAVNLLLDHIHGSIHFGFFTLKLTPLNSVGLFLFLSNVLGFLVLYFFLKEPPTKETESQIPKAVDENGVKFWRSFMCAELLVPHMSVFCFNATGQLIIAGMAPAASDALGWGPVGVSAVMAAGTFMTTLAMFIVVPMSKRGVSDESIWTAGLCLSTIGYTLIYFFWKNPTNAILFAFPVFITALDGPFIAIPTRSVYTKAINSKPYLRDHQGTLQAMLSMTMSIASFVGPGLVSAFVLRTPAQVAASRHHYEFTPYALFAPLLTIVTLLGVLYLRFGKRNSNDKGEWVELAKDEEMSETSSLLEYRDKDSVDPEVALSKTKQ